MVRRVRLAKLGMNRYCDLKRELVRRCKAISEYYASDESALDSFTVFNGNIASVNEGLLLSVALALASGTTAKQRYQSLGRSDKHPIIGRKVHIAYPYV